MFKVLSLIIVCLLTIGASRNCYSQESTVAQSEAGPISDMTAPIALGSLGVECQADFQMRISADKAGQVARPVIVVILSNIDNYMTVDPKVRFYVEAPGGFEGPYLQYTWLRRIAPDKSLTYVWELSEAKDWKPGLYKCVITTTGRMGESLHDPVHIRYELTPTDG